MQTGFFFAVLMSSHWVRQFEAQMPGIPLCAWCVISLPQGRSLVNEAPCGAGGGASLFPPVSDSQGYRRGGTSKATTCRISFNMRPVSYRESPSGLGAPPQVSRPFFLILGTEVSCFCLNSCQTGWTHTHDEFTPLWGYLWVCAVFITVGLLHAINTERWKCGIFHTQFLYKHICEPGNTFFIQLSTLATGYLHQLYYYWLKPFCRAT